MFISVLRVRLALSSSGDGILCLFMAQSVKQKKQIWSRKQKE